MDIETDKMRLKWMLEKMKMFYFDLCQWEFISYLTYSMYLIFLKDKQWNETMAQDLWLHFNLMVGGYLQFRILKHEYLYGTRLFIFLVLIVRKQREVGHHVHRINYIHIFK